MGYACEFAFVFTMHCMNYETHRVIIGFISRKTATVNHRYRGRLVLKNSNSLDQESNIQIVILMNVSVVILTIPVYKLSK